MTDYTANDWGKHLNAATLLDDLLNRVRGLRDVANAGDPVALHALDSLMPELPVFGGVEPDDTTEIWSWDSERLLVGAGDNLEIVDREA